MSKTLNTNNNINIKLSKLSKTESSSALTESFLGTKGKLIWPVQEGIVIKKFGKQPHPVFQNIEIDNLGVDIRSSKGREVYATFDGIVLVVTKVPDLNYMIILQHGEYFTAYARLEETYIKAQDKIRSKQKIGLIALEKGNAALLQFQIWKGSTRLDPYTWLEAY